jgi:hypothetical protein
VKRFAFVTIALVIVACATRPGGEDIAYDLPSRDQYIDGGVSFFMEKRCGALDCHGQEGRALRLYSKDGLRFAKLDGGARDQRDTTPEERVENYRATVGLEPEQMSQCVQSSGDCSLLLLSLKPLDISGGGVRHKGGPVLRNSENDDGWMCLQTWLGGSVDPSRCRSATELR